VIYTDREERFLQCEVKDVNRIQTTLVCSMPNDAIDLSVKRETPWRRKGDESIAVVRRASRTCFAFADVVG